MAGSDRLTASDRELIARARVLAAGDGPGDLRRYLRKHGRYQYVDIDTDYAIVFRDGFYTAQDLVSELADLVERLAGESTGA